MPRTITTEEYFSKLEEPLKKDRMLLLKNMFCTIKKESFLFGN